MSGILSGPLDSNERGGKARKAWPRQPAEKGLLVRHRTTGHVGRVVKFAGRQVTLRDERGREHTLPVADGAFSVKGSTVTLVRPAPSPTAAGPRQTASGSVAPTDTRARVARPSRIMVEGLHDAELVEKVWGDDLRAEGVVVEPLHGADDLAAVVAAFEPSPQRRLGILLDHLVPHTKEWHLANEVDHPDVMITGHPYVDVWQAIKPSAVGIDAWPDVPKGTDWKTGICAGLGFKGAPSDLWPKLLGSVASFRDLEAGLVGAVEQLIDFVAPPPMD